MSTKEKRVSKLKMMSVEARPEGFKWGGTKKSPSRKKN